MANTSKSDRDYYLIGEPLTKIIDEKLPSRKDVLSRFIYSRSTGQSFSESLKKCAVELEKIWALANIPTQNHYRVQHNINSLHEKWIGVKKNKNRRSKAQLQNEEKLSCFLKTLFDISYNDFFKSMKTDDKIRLGIEAAVIRVTDKSNERKEYFRKLVTASVDVHVYNNSEETIPSSLPCTRLLR